MKKGGAPGACYDSFHMATCKATGTYATPDPRRREAIDRRPRRLGRRRGLNYIVVDVPGW